MNIRGMNIYDEYQNARVEGFIPAECEFEDYLIAEVKRLRDLHILACDYLQSISNGTLPDSEWPHIHAMIRGEEE
jgi:hypothetical protein